MSGLSMVRLCRTLNIELKISINLFSLLGIAEIPSKRLKRGYILDSSSPTFLDVVLRGFFL